MNTRNLGKVIGRVSSMQKFDNTDGSRKIKLSIAVQDNFKNADGKKATQFVPVEAFIAKDKKTNGVFDYMHVGDLVSTAYEVRNNNYTDKNGQPVYGIVLVVKSVDLLESKAVTDARQAKKDGGNNSEPEFEYEPTAESSSDFTPAPAPAQAEINEFADLSEFDCEDVF